MESRIGVTLGAVNDSLIEGTHSQLLAVHVSSDDADFQQLQIPAIPVQIHDNDFLPPAEILITETNNQSLVSEDGQTDSISLRLSRQPTSPVTILLISNRQISLSHVVAVFDQDNWNVPFQVAVSARDDRHANRQSTVELELIVQTADADFQLASTSLRITVLDNDQLSQMGNRKQNNLPYSDYS
ncbi:MAG: hypothetical protein R3C28_17955 [Pirellulaceae bacterium]